MNTMVCISARSGGLLLFGVLATGAGALVSSALASETVADVDRFCRENVSPSAFSNVDRGDGSLLCSDNLGGGLGLVHLKIPPESVCGIQYQTERFRREGDKLFCITGTEEVAQEPIDLEEYCRDTYGQEALVTRNNVTGKPMCTLRTDGGLGLLHHKIDPGLLCEGKSGRFEGNTLRCDVASKDTESDPQRAAQKPIDLEAYCRDTYGLDAFVTINNVTGRPMCSLRTDGGLGLRHHKIEPSPLCGGRPGRFEGNALRCDVASEDSDKRKTAVPDRERASPDGERADPDRLTPEEYQAALEREPPPLSPEDVIDTGGSGDLTESEVTFAHLKDCGGAGVSDVRVMFMDPNGLDGKGWETQGVSKLCPGMTGGKVVEFLAHCYRTSPLNYYIRRTPSGRPLCWRDGRPEDDNLSEQSLNESNFGNSAACLGEFVSSEALSKPYSDYSILFKYEVRKTEVECFFMKRSDLIRILRGEEERISEWEM